jgi:hypothetical protein
VSREDSRLFNVQGAIDSLHDETAAGNRLKVLMVATGSCATRRLRLMASTLSAETRQLREPDIVRVLPVTAQKTEVLSGVTVDNEGDFAPQDWALFFGISLIWGASFLLMAEALEAFTPGIVTLWRASLGALVMWIMRPFFGRVGPIRASFVTYLIPVVSLGLGVWLHDDSVTCLALIGAPITIVGAFLAGRRTR